MSSPQDDDSLTGIRTRDPFPALLAGRHRQSTFLASRIRMSGPPVTRNFGAATLVPDAFWPALAITVAVFLARSIRQTAWLPVSSTYGAPYRSRTIVIRASGPASAGKVNSVVERIGTTPYSRSSPASA